MAGEQYFSYGEKEIQYLSARDPILGAVIRRIGYIHRLVIEDFFTAFVYAIIGQQISTKAQITIWKKIEATLEVITPEVLATMPAGKLRECGVSQRKENYIRNLANDILNKKFNIEELTLLSDHEVCTRLCRLQGVGLWTAQMLLIFSMQRPNVLSYQDLGIQRGMRMIYGRDEITREEFEDYYRCYSPYATVASFYLWQVSNGALPDLKDPALVKIKPKSVIKNKA